MAQLTCSRNAQGRGLDILVSQHWDIKVSSLDQFDSAGRGKLLLMIVWYFIFRFPLTPSHCAMLHVNESNREKIFVVIANP